MERVDKYVNSVYKHIGGDKEEIEILKEEMKNHLLQMIEELKSEGKSQDESISIAIKRFGEETQIENELVGVFKFVNKNARKALIIALSFILAAIISASIFIVGSELYIRQYTARNTGIFNIMNSYGEENITKIDENISKLVSESKGKIRYVAMFRVHNSGDALNRSLKNLEYVYPKKYIIDRGNVISQQIITRKGMKYNVDIDFGDSPSPTPMYIRNIGKSTFIWIACCLVSMIAWILIKINARTKLNL